ncbi:hypothetical protein QBC46DRAFT_354316 [Diplogelasinospora grovesii]|uniref:Protein HRI1 n=1 Tax=Diplogelasinospora grovesii TaxID=303347 RepID=A0AAN6N727_9PEZI|nr:hypothetical protein QBC46DRAFT_354316 [Diplogelasinospora grovesii]
MADISKREYIRWLPDEPSEPTMTMVLTSPERRFVDLRILHPDPNGDKNTCELPPERLEWAIAGTSSSWPLSPPLDEGNGPVMHARWEHWIDSRTLDVENAADEGINYPRPDGTTLEKGRMVNPATGLEADYEELWVSIPPSRKLLHDWDRPNNNEGELAIVVIVLQLHNDPLEKRGMVVRVGDYCQGLLRKGDNITAERWVFEIHGEPSIVEKVGEGLLPCALAMDAGEKMFKGQQVTIGDDVWNVVEVARL